MDEHGERRPRSNRHEVGTGFLRIAIGTYIIGAGILALLAILNGARTVRHVGEALQFAGFVLTGIGVLACLGSIVGFVPWVRSPQSGGPMVVQSGRQRSNTTIFAVTLGFVLIALTGVILEL